MKRTYRQRIFSGHLDNCTVFSRENFMYKLIGLILLLMSPSSSSEDLRVVVSNGLKARVSPSLESEILTIVRPAVRLLVKGYSGKNDEWLKVEDPARNILNGKPFWVYGEFLKPPGTLVSHFPSIDHYIISNSPASWSIYKVSREGTFTYASPEHVDGNYFGCNDGEGLIKNTSLYPPYCAFKGKLVNGTGGVVIGLCPEEVTFCNIAFIKLSDGKYCLLGDSNTYYGEYKSYSGFHAGSVCPNEESINFFKNDLKYLP